MDYNTEQEIKKIWRTLKCKANCNSINKIVTLTKEELLALINSSSVEVGVTYIVTNIEGFTKVITEGIDSNYISQSSVGLLIVPNYNVSGNNLGQLNPNSPQTVADGERVIWADYYWENNSGSPVTPTIIDPVTLDTPMTMIDKSQVNEYELLSVSIELDNQLQVAEIYNANNDSTYSYHTTSNPILYLNLPVNNPNIVNSDVNGIGNHLGSVFSAKNNNLDFPIISNVGGYSSIIIEGSNNEFTGNNITDDGNATSIKLNNTCRFNNNTASDASYNIAHYLCIELRDNSEVIGNQITGDGAIWDIHAGEECKVNGNILNAGTSIIEETSTVIQDVIQTYQDEVNENEFTGANSKITAIYQFGFSKCNSNTFSGDDTKIANVRQSKSEITNCTFNVNNQKFEELDMRNATITSATGISITNCEFTGIDLDLTGFTVDINNETISSGKGWFTVTHDFATSPLNSGSSVLYNLIPIGARITTIKTFGNASGGGSAELAFGIDTDAPNILPSAVLATVNAGQTYNAVSAAATANRSLAITAAIDDVTGGSVTVYVEFAI